MSDTPEVALVCAECGSRIGRNIVRMQLEHYELISHETGHGRVVTVDAAVTCSTSCLTIYLASELEAAS